MDIENSARVNNRVKVGSVVVAGVVYLALAISTFGIALIVMLPCAWVAWFLGGRVVSRATSTEHRFRKSFPLQSFGVQYGNFEHVFHYRRSLDADILEAVIRELRNRTPVRSIEPMTLTDSDRDLSTHETRLFMRADAGQTQRGTTLTLIMQLTAFGNMQSVHWWVMGGGYVDRNKRFNFIAYAWLTIWFWIVPYFNQAYDLLQPLRTVHEGFYNSADITTRVRCIHEAVFAAMTLELERHGIDTSDIKLQRADVMNISVSGGKLDIGNIAQGRQNRLVAKLTRVGQEMK